MSFDWNDPLVIFNAVEAAWWLLCSVLVFWFGRRWRLVARWAWLLAVVSLFWFGISDVIEMKTGAWWRPIGLLILKGACLTGIIVSAVVFFQSERRPTQRDL